MDFSSNKTFSLGTFFMDIFRLLNCLVGFREGVLKFQMNNVFCIFWLKTGKEGQRFPGCTALLCRSGGSPLLQVLRLKEGKNHIKYFSLRALEFKKTQQRNSISDMNVHISGNRKCLTAQN